MHSLATMIDDGKQHESVDMQWFPLPLCEPMSTHLQGNRLGAPSWADAVNDKVIGSIDFSFSIEHIDRTSALLKNSVELGLFDSEKELNRSIKRLNNQDSAKEEINRLNSAHEYLLVKRFLVTDDLISEQFDKTLDLSFDSLFYFHTETDFDSEMQHEIETKEEEPILALTTYHSYWTAYCPLDNFSETIQDALEPFIGFIANVGNFSNIFELGHYSELDETLYEISSDKLDKILKRGETLNDLLMACKEHLSSEGYEHIIGCIEEYYEIDLDELNTLGEEDPNDSCNNALAELKTTIERHFARSQTEKYFCSQEGRSLQDFKSHYEELVLDDLVSETERGFLCTLIKMIEIVEPYYVKTDYDFDYYSDLQALECVQSIIVSEKHEAIANHIGREHDENLMNAGDHVEIVVSVTDDRCYHATINILIGCYLIHGLADIISRTSDGSIIDRK